MPDFEAMVSPAYATFLRETRGQAEAWSAMVDGVAKASALDAKTSALAYLAVLAAQRLESGLPFHVWMAKQAGATREEVASAILVGLPAAGLCVTHALPAALAAYDADSAAAG
jgi:alkylhydroperoxidase/carboxymuconolactone decarboxylase family protein YurZ